MPRVTLPDNVALWFTFLPGFSPQAASQIIGFEVAEVPGQSRSKSLPKVTTQDPSAVQFGDLLWRKGNVFWSPEPPLTTAEIRKVAKEAGVHLYGDGGEQILVNESLFLVHSAKDGERTYMLPSKAKVTDAFSGEVVAADADHFTIPLKPGETKVFELHY
jgi:hypothetical protein